MIKKIAISGKAGSGKNTVAQLISDHLVPFECRIFAFANPIKKMVNIMAPHGHDALYGPSQLRGEKVNNKSELTFRDCLVTIGKLGRQIDPDLWVNLEIDNAANYLAFNNSCIAIFADVRFKNEFKRLRQNDYYMIRVVRPNNKTNVNDISEVDLDSVSDSNFDHVLINDGSINQLEESIDQLVTVWRES